MKKIILAVVVAAAALTAPAVVAQPLKIVTVSAPPINFVFNPTGVVQVQDFTSPIWKTGFLQSRNYKGAAGSPGAGLWVYEYRLDLRNVVGVTSIPFVTSLTIHFGTNVGTLDFNGDKSPDDVFVVTKGGLGNIGLKSAVRSGNDITFTFASPVGGGAAPGMGDSTFFFGLVAKAKRNVTSCTVTSSPTLSTPLQAWTPLVFTPGPPGPTPH